MIRALRKLDPSFEERKSRGKGAHRLIYHPGINGRPAQFPLPFHGQNATVHPKYLKNLQRRFDLPDDWI